MLVSIIAAMGNDRVIGKDNDIPWYLPDDVRHFKSTTSNHHVIMGRKNWESLPSKFRPLPDRTNIIITRQSDYAATGALMVSNLKGALDIAKWKGDREAFVIGGGEIYQMAIEIADRIYLTEINQTFCGQVTFPEFDKSVWHETSRVHHGIDERHPFAFDWVVYDRG